MIRLGGAAHAPYIEVFNGLKKHFQRQGIDLDWVLYSDWDALVDAFVNGEVDLAWNGPLSYVKIKRRLQEPCRVVAMRDNDLDVKTVFISHPDSGIDTVEDLMRRRFAFGSRGSVESGVLAHYFLRQVGINPRRDLESCTFYEDRQPSGLAGDRDVIERVRSREYDAGAVSHQSLQKAEEDGGPPEGAVRVFWSSEGYSHCCFTGQSHMDPALSEKITQAFISIDPSDPDGKAVLDGEHCNTLVPGITEGWEILEKAAEEEGLI